MSVVGLEISVEGQVQAVAMVETFGNEIRNWKPYFSSLETELRKFFIRQFAGEGVGPHGRWAALSPAYAERKAVLAPGRKILAFSGRLRGALTRKNSPYSLRVVTGDQFAYGTKGVPYAIYHQSMRPRTKLKRRPPIDLDRNFNAALRRRLTEHARRAAVRARRRAIKGVSP